MVAYYRLKQRAERVLSRRTALAWLGAAASGQWQGLRSPGASARHLARGAGPISGPGSRWPHRSWTRPAAPQLHAAGWKDRATRTPADPTALFKIASLSKLYIAAAAQLTASGHFSFSQTLAEGLPEHAADLANAERITVEMLLQHRSGLFNFTDDERYPGSTCHVTSPATCAGRAVTCAV